MGGREGWRGVVGGSSGRVGGVMGSRMGFRGGRGMKGVLGGISGREEWCVVW